MQERRLFRKGRTVGTLVSQAVASWRPLACPSRSGQGPTHLGGTGFLRSLHCQPPGGPREVIGVSVHSVHELPMNG